MTENATGALAGLRVLDLTRILAGPLCAQTLGDMGAEVIKVERPGHGDDTRAWGPPWINMEEKISSYFAAANRGKKSLTINISSPQGKKIIHELVKISDVVIENYKLGDLKRYDLDYESLKAINPKLVYCSITGYGQNGPNAHKPGYDFVFQAIGGMMSITGEADTEPGGGPQKVGTAIADILTGMYSTIAILAALNSRDKTGLGQYIDMALLDSIIALGGNQITGYFADGKIPFRYGNAHASLVPYQVFAVQDGEIVIAVGNDTQWQRYCEAINRTDLAKDPKWEKVTGRITGRSELIPQLAKTMLEKSMKEWIAILEQYDVPCGPINNYQQVFADPHVIHRDIKVDTAYEDGSIVSTIASPLRLQSTPPEYKRPPPKLGDSNFEVLNELLNYSAEAIEQLKKEKIV